MKKCKAPEMVKIRVNIEFLIMFLTNFKKANTAKVYYRAYNIEIKCMTIVREGSIMGGKKVCCYKVHILHVK